MILHLKIQPIYVVIISEPTTESSVGGRMVREEREKKPTSFIFSTAVQF